MIFPAGRTTAVLEKGEKFCPGFPAQPGVKSWRILSNREQNPELVTGSQVCMEMKPEAGRDGEEFPGLLFPEKSSGSSAGLGAAPGSASQPRSSPGICSEY